MARPLSGKTAIVTGASSGIGLVIAKNISELGSAVVLHARRQALLDQVAADLAARRGQALAVAGDAGNKADINTLMQRVLSWDGGANYRRMLAPIEIAESAVWLLTRTACAHHRNGHPAHRAGLPLTKTLKKAAVCVPQYV